MCRSCQVVKPLHCKNPAQHAADLHMLQQQDELSAVFLNPITGAPKSIDCIRCDGACDEGPGHEEVQFYWTEKHLQEAKLVTLVTTRSSGSSYLNRVELQNGCLTRAHSNLFIPSTLNGSCMSSETGKVDKEVLHRNLSDAIDVDLQRCNGCQCGHTVIHLYEGPQSD